MKKRLLVLFLIVTAALLVCAGNAMGTTLGTFSYGPYLQNVSQDAITIMWVSDEMVTASVEYSVDSSYSGIEYGSCVAESGVYICKVRLTGLGTESTYNYIAYGDNIGSEVQTFTTSPKRNTAFGFCVWGDSQQEVSASNGIFTGMVNSDTDFGLATGDVVQNATWSYTQNPFLKYTLDKLGRVKPVFIGYGNHDGGVSGVTRKFTEQPGTLNYTFTYGNAHYTVLDFADYGGNWVSSVPTAWVESVLGSEEAQSATWRFVVIHVPPYSERWIDGNALLRSELVPLLEEYGVDMVFSGHTHEYERGNKNGVYYVISGCGSYLDTYEPIVRDWEHMTVGGAQDIAPFVGGLAHGFTEIQIDNNKLELKQHAYYSNGSYYGVIDNFSITKILFESDFNLDGKLDYDDVAYISDDWVTKLSVDVYLGESFDDVNNATVSSEAYVGNFSTALYLPESLEPNRTYYWRVDEMNSNGTQKGETWQFRTGDNNANMGWWKLDGYAEDMSGFGNDGVGFGDIEMKDDPNWGSCFSFDGDDDYIQMPNEPAFDFTSEVTIAAWVRMSSVDEGLYTIASKGGSFWLYQDNYVGAVVFSCDGLGRNVQSSVNICDDKWHHVAAVYDGAERAIYIDGIKNASRPTTGAMMLNDWPLTIGDNGADIANNNFNGMMRELRIYSGGLPDEQIFWLSKTKNLDPWPFNGQDNVSSDSALTFYPQMWMENKKADLNKDFIINFEDFSILAEEWLEKDDTLLQ